MEQFMRHFIRAMHRAKPEDIVSMTDDDDEDDENYGDDIVMDDSIAECFDYSADDIPEFLENSSNVYRTENFIVRQQIVYRSDFLIGSFMCSRDTYFARTPERDRQYEEFFFDRALPDGKRIPVLMYIREYID